MQATEENVFAVDYSKFEMCAACDERYVKLVEDGGIPTFTFEQLQEEEIELGFEEAMSLMREGILVVRKAYKDNEFPKIIGITKRDPEKQEEETIATFSVEGRTPIQTVSLSTKEILAQDYIVVYVPEDL